MAAGAFMSLHAQSREETRRVILGSPNENGSYGNRDVILGGNDNARYPSYPDNRYPGNAYPNNGNYNNRPYQLDQINREYSAKTESIRNNRYLSSKEKERMIRQLEKDRKKRISEINRQYVNNNRKYSKNPYNRKDNNWNQYKYGQYNRRD